MKNKGAWLGWGVAGALGLTMVVQSGGEGSAEGSAATIEAPRIEQSSSTVDQPFGSEGQTAVSSPAAPEAAADPLEELAPIDQSGPSQYSCEYKTCKQMTSCEEAYHHLNVCGQGRLDRDNDGVPCEIICG